MHTPARGLAVVQTTDVLIWGTSIAVVVYGRCIEHGTHLHDLLLRVVADRSRDARRLFEVLLLELGVDLDHESIAGPERRDKLVSIR